jgi:hypothetical protein
LDFTTGRTVGLLAVFCIFFCEVVDVRLTNGFFARSLDPADFNVADLDVAGFETLRFGDFEAAALLA